MLLRITLELEVEIEYSYYPGEAQGPWNPATARSVDVDSISLVDPGFNPIRLTGILHKAVMRQKEDVITELCIEDHEDRAIEDQIRRAG